MLLACFFAPVTSCNKTDEATPSHAPKARLLNEEESDQIVADVENFYDYTEILADDPNAPTEDFTETVSLEEANALIENTFNYYFARQNYQMVDELYDTLTVPFNSLVDEHVDINEAGNAFNSLRVDLKNFFEDQEAGTEFMLADAEIVDGGLRLVGVFGQNPMPSGIVPVTDFGSGDKWNIYEKGGKYGTTQYDNVYGAPEILTNAINFDIKQPIYTFVTNITMTDAHTLDASLYSLFLPTAYSAPDNPMYEDNPTYWRNTLFHYILIGSVNSDPNENWITPEAMTYYRTWLPVAAAAYSSQNNKTLVKLIVKMSWLTSGDPWPFVHWIKVFDGDLSTKPLPSAIPLNL